MDLLATILVQTEIGLVSLKQLKFTNWNQFSELIFYVDLLLQDQKTIQNFALRRWPNHFQEESNCLNESSATIIKDKIVSTVGSGFMENMTPSIASKLECLQMECLTKLDGVVIAFVNVVGQRV